MARRHLVLLLIILLGAFAVRALWLDYTDIEGDEAFSYVFSIDTLEGIYKTTLAIAEPHPIGSYYFNHFWLQLAGDSAFSFRFPSVWFGVLAAALTYRLGRRLRLGYRNRRNLIPLLGALLVALSPFLVAESRNARMYSMSLALTVLSTWIALELVHTTGRPSNDSGINLLRHLKAIFPPRLAKYTVAYVLVSWIALNVHYFAGTILVAQNAYVLMLLLSKPLRLQRRLLMRWVIAESAILLAFLPWYLLVRDILRTYPGLSYYSPALDFMVQLMSGVFMVGQNAGNVEGGFAIIGLVVMLYGLGRLILAGNESRWGALLLICYLAVPFGMAYLDSRGRSTFAERQVIATSVGFYLLVAAAISPLWEVGVSWLKRVADAILPLGMSFAVLIGIAAGLHGYVLSQRIQPDSWRTFIAYVSRFSVNVTPAQLRVGQNYPEPAITFYYHGSTPGFTLPVRANDLESAKTVAQEFASAGVERVILREDANSWWNGGKATDIAQTALSSRFTKVDQFFTGRWWVMVYGRMPVSELKPVNIAFSNGIILKAAATRGLTLPSASIPGKVLEVYLQWDSKQAKLTGTEKLFIHILDQYGQAPSQLDVPLLAQDIAMPEKAYSVPLADTLPIGAYVVRVGIYDPSLPGAPRLRTSDGNDGVQIGTLTIEQ